MASINMVRNADGSKSYRVRVRLKGHPMQTATFERKSDASRWAQKTETDIREGRYFNTNEAQRKTVSELIDRYIEREMPRKAPGTQKNQLPQLQWWNQRIGELSLASVTPTVLSDAIQELLKDGRKAATAVRYLAVISHSFSYAVKELEWLHDNPVLKVRKPRESKGRDRFLSPEEKDRLLEACKASENSMLYPAVLIALSTGMRRGEQFGLTWDDVDLAVGKAILRNTKNGETRTVPITGPALEELKKLSRVRRIDDNRVFASSRGSGENIPRGPFEKAMKAAEIEDFRWHDLRHTFASYLAMNGATLTVLMDAMGHKSLEMVRRYAHLAEDHVSGEVRRMTENVFGAV